MENRRLDLAALLTLCLAASAGCATDPGSAEQRQKMYDSEARVNDKIAKDWRKSGVDSMAAYHEQEAAKARHNRFAAGCSGSDDFIFTILWGSDACQTK